MHNDILYVKELLGHKHIDNTLIYVQLEKTIFQSQNNEWIVKVAKSVEEVCQLVEVGFEYVTGEYMDGGKIFKAQVVQDYSIKLLSGIDFSPIL